MASFIHIDKENAPGSVSAMSRAPSLAINRGGKTFASASSVSVQPVRKVFGDVNRQRGAIGRSKSGEGTHKSTPPLKPNFVLIEQPAKPAIPVKPPSASKHSTILSCKVVTEDKAQTVKRHQEEVEDMEQMYIPFEEPDTFADILAADYLIPPENEESSDEDSLISCSSEEDDFNRQDWCLEEECGRGDLEICLEALPSIHDIPLPPMEDLLPRDEDFFNSLT